MHMYVVHFYARKSVSLSVTQVDQAKTVQARITKSSPYLKDSSFRNRKAFPKIRRGLPRTSAL